MGAQKTHSMIKAPTGTTDQKANSPLQELTSLPAVFAQYAISPVAHRKDGSTTSSHTAPRTVTASAGIIILPTMSSRDIPALTMN